MCEAVTVAMTVASTLLGAYSQVQQGKSQKEWANYQADQAEADARAERGAAEVQADKIRKMARRQQSEATAALAASGVDVGEGTAVHINREIYEGAEEDALTTIFGGVDREKRGYAQASADRSRGSQAASAGYLGATNTLLGGAYRIGSGWKTSSSVASNRNSHESAHIGDW